LTAGSNARSEIAFTLRTAGAGGIMLYLDESDQLRAIRKMHDVVRAIGAELALDAIDLVPAYHSLLIVFDPLKCTHHEIKIRVRCALKTLRTQNTAPAKQIELPVYYAPEVGEDLLALALRADLSIEDVIALHSATTYHVFAIGFAPGFAYLGDVDDRIAAPRLNTPRVNVPKGSVAIAQNKTAVYPSASPGGWNLIGRCPTPLFMQPSFEQPSSKKPPLEKTEPNIQHLTQDLPSLPVAVGDRVPFYSVSREEYVALG